MYIYLKAKIHLRALRGVCGDQSVWTKNDQETLLI